MAWKDASGKLNVYDLGETPCLMRGSGAEFHLAFRLPDQGIGRPRMEIYRA